MAKPHRASAERGLLGRARTLDCPCRRGPVQRIGGCVQADPGRIVDSQDLGGSHRPGGAGMAVHSDAPWRSYLRQGANAT
jgi:hypothetical protein